MRHFSSTISILLISCLAYCLGGLFFVSCNSSSEAEEHKADSLNFCSYRYRYSNIDSALQCAKRALALSDGYAAGRAFAFNNLAYVAYQQMRYGTTVRYLDEVYRLCRNQVELLCADVMYMKVAQRTGEGLLFFKHRNSALNRIKRIIEDESILSPAQQSRLRYARSEFHIVSSTYYFYYGQDSKAIEEINRTALDSSLPSDTAQWIYYRYMLGSGGLIQGDPHDVSLREFGHLFATYTLAQATGMIYFQANALQAMASLLDNPDIGGLIVRRRPNAIAYLQNQHKDWHPLPKIDDYAHLSLVMADRAVHLFKDSKDLFQLACAYRTVGEIYFRHGKYNHALSQFRRALDLVESQKQRSEWEVPFWNFRIQEYLSLTYSALGDKHNSDLHRNIYLDYLEKYTQDFELKERKLQLEQELKHTRLSLFSLLGLILLSVLLLWLLIRRMKSQSRQVSDSIYRFDETSEWADFELHANAAYQALADYKQEKEEEIHLHRMHISDYCFGNVERRAKVSLVYAIIPYLDRIIAEVDRMRRQGFTNDTRLSYVSELAGEIMQVNSVLTDWIQMRQGQCKLHITTFPIRQVLDIIQGSKMVFVRQGITLRVEPSDCKVKADMALTLFMINTLCDNARKFTPSGGSVTVSAKPCMDGVEVSVCDTGYGLSPHDVDVINQSKIYDPSQLSDSKVNKGFGFGIMNCKGIIAKYRKTSAKFRACDFGVESRLNEGSRFWFRLPGIMSLLMAFFFMVPARAVDSLLATRDSICRLNITGCYAEAYSYGDSVLSQLQAPIDTSGVIFILNEMAVSSLALKQWDNYYNCNRECVRLHNLYTADDSLPAYCRQMQQMKSNNVFVYAFLVLCSLLALVLFYLLSLRSLLRKDSYAQALYAWMLQRISASSQLISAYSGELRKQDWSSLLSQTPEWMHNIPIHDAESCRECLFRIQKQFQKADEEVEQTETLVSVSRRLRFEEDRLYVMNQVLDNCLSTIKHETMYYPARTQQLVEYMRQHVENNEQASCLAELSELVHFYRSIYGLLYQQAERQMEQKNFYRESVSLSDLNADLPALKVLADRMLLNLLMRTLSEVESVSPILSARVESGFVFVQFLYPGVFYSGDELSDLFQPVTSRIPLLVAKQIIREHDANCGHVGLRLNAESTPQGYYIQFSLIQS